MLFLLFFVSILCIIFRFLFIWFISCVAHKYLLWKSHTHWLCCAQLRCVNKQKQKNEMKKKTCKYTFFYSISATTTITALTTAMAKKKNEICKFFLSISSFIYFIYLMISTALTLYCLSLIKWQRLSELRALFFGFLFFCFFSVFFGFLVRAQKKQQKYMCTGWNYTTVYLTRLFIGLQREVCSWIDENSFCANWTNTQFFLFFLFFFYFMSLFVW